MDNNQTRLRREEAMNKIKHKADIVKRALGTADGEALMKILQEEFNSDSILVPNDSHSTHYNLGRRDVVIYLQQLQRFEK